MGTQEIILKNNSGEIRLFQVGTVQPACLIHVEIRERINRLNNHVTSSSRSWRNQRED